MAEMLSIKLSTFFANEFKRKLLSVQSFMHLMQHRAVVTRFILKSFSDPMIAQIEEDLVVKSFINNTYGAILQQTEVKNLTEKFLFFSKQILEINALLDDAKAYDVRGKSYHEKQVLKKLVSHHIATIGSDVLPLLKIFDELTSEFKLHIHNVDELKDKLGIIFLWSLTDIRKLIENLSKSKTIGVIENKLNLVSEQLFLYHRILVLKIRFMNDEIRNPIREVIKHLIIKNEDIY